ncbi:hypothetical protein [Streptomyces yerevanensis]|uniref:hypothetical protein n=1 Tax=Streptomyces yerevanensis TaxID=66378 RepID=UPI000A4D8DC6|nr:hypothetical protein [Streptomyces yerevanensis]
MPATGAVRAGFGIGTTGEEVDRLVAAVDALVRSGPRWHYERMAGLWTPVPDTRTLPD